MGLVIDASMAAAWFLPDEQSGATDAVLQGLGGITGYVPPLFWHEARNIFLMAERRGRLAPARADLALHQLRLLPIETAHDGDDLAVLAIARAHGLTAYDAAYLALAKKRALPLATLDGPLAKAAQAEGVALRGLLGA